MSTVFASAQWSGRYPAKSRGTFFRAPHCRNSTAFFERQLVNLWRSAFQAPNEQSQLRRAYFLGL
jgi:hypothetical protein